MMEWRIWGILLAVLLFLLVISMLLIAMLLFFILLCLKKKCTNNDSSIALKIKLKPIVFKYKGAVGNTQGKAIAKSKSEKYENSANDNQYAIKPKSIGGIGSKKTENSLRLALGNAEEYIKEINAIIQKKGYMELGDEGWVRIGVGDGVKEIGDSVTLKVGNGNVRVKSYFGEKYYGIPAKAQWKECDFKNSAYSECFNIPDGVEDNSNYEIIKISKCAYLVKEKDTFRVERKGSIEVKKI